SVSRGRPGPRPFPTRRSSDLPPPLLLRHFDGGDGTRREFLGARSGPARLYRVRGLRALEAVERDPVDAALQVAGDVLPCGLVLRSEEHTSELQSREKLVCRLL